MKLRRLTLRLYPTSAQKVDMDKVRLAQQALYNAALEERIGAWKQKVRISRNEQHLSLTQIRSEDPDFARTTRRWQMQTLDRLDRAFKAFFRRVKLGQTPGFPRFKSFKRYPGWTSLRGDGFKYKPKITVKGQMFNGVLWLSGTGAVQARGKARWKAEGSKILQLDVSQRAGRWYASLAIECKPERQMGSKAAGLDWGVTDFATLAYVDGTTAVIANDRLFQKQQMKAAERQRAASKSLRGRRSNRAKRKHLQIARAHARLANQRKDRAHKLSANLVKEHVLIATEELQIANITRSAKGTVDAPGKMVAQKSGLNREILDTAPGMLMNMLRYKAEEAGCALEFINTRKVKPSQTCPGCGNQVKKTLAERVHSCGCGLTMSRDGAAALVMLLASDTYSGRKPAPDSPPKTPPRASSEA